MSRRYEIVYIFDSALEEEQINESLARFHELLKSADTPEPATDVNHWGKRTLAYPVAGKEVGYYVVVRLDTSPELLGEFERALKLDEGLLRHLLVLNEGEQPVAPRDADGDGGKGGDGGKSGDGGKGGDGSKGGNGSEDRTGGGDGKDTDRRDS